MIRKQINERLYRHVGAVFAPLGFSLVRDEERSNTRLARSVGEVTQSVGFPLWVYGSVFRFSLYFAFRSDDAEDITNPFSGILPEFQESSTTCLVLLESLTTEVDQRGIEASTVATLQERVAWLAPILEHDVFPFLDTHQDIASLDRLLNGNERNLCLQRTEPNHSMNALTVAYLHKRPDLTQLMTSLREKLHGQENRAQFDRLVKHLKQHPLGK